MFYDKNGNMFCIGDYVVCEENIGTYPAGIELRVHPVGFRRVLAVAMIPLDMSFASKLTIVRRADGFSA